MKSPLLAASIISFSLASKMSAVEVDYSVISVPEERGLEFTCITQPNDYVAMPVVIRERNNFDWLTNRIINISPDGNNIAFISVRDGKSNIFIKDLSKPYGAAQRTNRGRIIDFNYSPDGSKICFAENRGNGYQIFVTDANSGFVCQQITSGADDYSPIFDDSMRTIYFARSEEQGVSIWSCSLDNNMLSSYTDGANPYPAKLVDGSNVVLYARTNGEGRGEIWMFDANKGTEQCIVSDMDHSFSSPMLSPNGRWIVCVGSSAIPINDKGDFYENTDIYVVAADGSAIYQLTFHAADDLSPAWSPDGENIYFVSQRGNTEGRSNIWRISFVPRQ